MQGCAYLCVQDLTELELGLQALVALGKPALSPTRANIHRESICVNIDGLVSGLDVGVKTKSTFSVVLTASIQFCDEKQPEVIGSSHGEALMMIRGIPSKTD